MVTTSIRLVQIKETDKRLGVKAGEIYESELYPYDNEKVSLLRRVPDGYDPGCNQYKSNIILLPYWKRENRGIRR